MMSHMCNVYQCGAMYKNWKMELVNAGKESEYVTSTRYTILLKIKDVIKMSSMSSDAMEDITV